MTRALGVMEVPVPLTADDLHQYQTGALRDGGLWTALRRLSDHDHSGGHGGAPVAGGGGGTTDVTISGTEGVTVVEAPANTFALGLTASPDANNTVEIRANGIYSASGAIPPEYVTDAELATALSPYATDAEVAALQARVTALEAAVAAGDSALRAYVQRIMAVLDPGGPPPPP